MVVVVCGSISKNDDVWSFGVVCGGDGSRRQTLKI